MRIFLLALMAGSPLYAATYNFPILEKRLGGLDRKDGVELSHSCKIYDDSSAIKLQHVLDLAAKAEKAKLNKALHIRQQVPSVQVWVNIPTRMAAGPAATKLGSRSVLLLEDSSAMQTRDGAEAAELLKIVEDTCKDL